MRLQDKVALVTGGARGIGQAVSELFAKEGASVVIWDLLEEGQQVADDIVAQGGKCEFHTVSVSDKEAVESGIQSIVDKHGRLDILINNAGITRDKTLLKMSDEEWDQVIDVNLKSIFLCTRAAAAVMKEQKYGRIVSASSTTGLRGNYGQTNYAAAKAGIIGMTKTWAMELGKYGVTVNAIAPGYTITPMTEKIPDHIKDLAKFQIPVGFLADPIDIAYGYLYLASDESRFVTGICLPIDGGSTR